LQRSTALSKLGQCVWMIARSRIGPVPTS
jgi:hypothetical protein